MYRICHYLKYFLLGVAQGFVPICCQTLGKETLADTAFHKYFRKHFIPLLLKPQGGSLAHSFLSVHTAFGVLPFRVENKEGFSHHWPKVTTAT